MEFRKITPEGFPGFEEVDCLFYQPGYLNTQKYENPVAFTFQDQDQLAGALVFNCQNDIATSLNRSPFGSMWLKEKCNQSTFEAFIAFVRQALSEHDIHRMEVTIPSSIYSEFAPATFWMKVGFQLATQEVNQHLGVNASFEQNLHHMEKRKLKKLQEGKLVFQMEPPTKEIIGECHAFIARCRKEQGLTINITIEKLLQLHASLPKKYSFFTARSGMELVAAVITCEVDQKHMYYFLPATDPLYRKDSPMVGLVNLIYQHCKQQGKQFLDLGISSINGQLQQGLYDFKHRLGAVESFKPTMYYKW